MVNRAVLGAVGEGLGSSSLFIHSIGLRIHLKHINYTQEKILAKINNIE